MRREFLLNIGFLIVVNLLIKPFYIFGIDRTVQNTVASQEYGLYFTLYNFTYLFYIINDFGLQNFNNRNLSQHRHLLTKYFPSFLTLKLMLGLLYLVLIWVGGHLAGYPAAYFRLLPLVGLNWTLMSLVLFLRSNISGLGWYRTDSLLSVLDRSLLILVCGFLLWTPSWAASFRIDWFVYAQTATLIITTLVAFVVVLRQISGWSFRFRPLYLLLILKQSYPYALVIFLMTLYTRIDGVMIERLLPNGVQETGIYAMAYRLLDAANVFGFLIAGLLLPMFSRMLREKVSVLPLLDLSLRLIWLVCLGTALAVFFYRQEIMEALYLEGDAYSGDILGYLMISFIAVCGSYLHGSLLTANGSLFRMNVVFAMGVILNVGLNAWLIPPMGALGAAVATCITQFVVWLGQAELVRRIFPQQLRWPIILRFSAFALLLALGIWQIRQFPGLFWLYRFLISFPLATLLALLLGVIQWRPLLAFLRKKGEF
jgi:O-antigen/teichoic acid export membrane protein